MLFARSSFEPFGARSLSQDHNGNDNENCDDNGEDGVYEHDDDDDDDDNDDDDDDKDNNNVTKTNECVVAFCFASRVFFWQSYFVSGPVNHRNICAVYRKNRWLSTRLQYLSALAMRILQFYTKPNENIAHRMDFTACNLCRYMIFIAVTFQLK